VTVPRGTIATVAAAIKEKYGEPPDKWQWIWPAKGKSLELRSKHNSGMWESIELLNKPDLETWERRLGEVRLAEQQQDAREAERKRNEEIRRRSKDL
jgi:hypothetical protein